MSTKLTIEDFEGCGNVAHYPTNDDGSVDQVEFDKGVDYAEQYFWLYSGLQASQFDARFSEVVKFNMKWLAFFYWHSNCACMMTDAAMESYEKAIDWIKGIGTGKTPAGDTDVNPTAFVNARICGLEFN